MTIRCVVAIAGLMNDAPLTAGVDPFHAASSETPPVPPDPALRDSIATRANDMLRLAILEELHAHPSMSLTEFFSAADIKVGSLEWEMIMDTPVDELTATHVVAGKIAKAPKRAVVSVAPVMSLKKVEEYLADAEQGFEFTTTDFCAWASMSSPRAIRALGASDRLEKHGEKRTAFWRVK